MKRPALPGGPVQFEWTIERRLAKLDHQEVVVMVAMTG